MDAVSMRLDRIRDVILRRPPAPDDERERKGREIEALAVKYESTRRIKDRLIEAWRRRQ
jgi:hypothetical protein